MTTQDIRQNIGDFASWLKKLPQQHPVPLIYKQALRLKRVTNVTLICNENRIAATIQLIRDFPSILEHTSTLGVFVDLVNDLTHRRTKPQKDRCVLVIQPKDKKESKSFTNIRKLIQYVNSIRPADCAFPVVRYRTVLGWIAKNEPSKPLILPETWFSVTLTQPLVLESTPMAQIPVADDAQAPQRWGDMDMDADAAVDTTEKVDREVPPAVLGARRTRGTVKRRGKTQK